MCLHNKNIFSELLLSRYLPREVDPLVYNMSHEDPGDVSYSEIGGLSEQIRELREVPSASNPLQILIPALSEALQGKNHLGAVEGSSQISAFHVSFEVFGLGLQ